MKRIRKSLALLLVICMTFGMGDTAFATEKNQIDAVMELETAAEQTTEEVNIPEETSQNETQENVVATALTMGEKPADGTTTNNPFVQGTAGSNSFRIPALVTLSDGTLVAAADTRWNTTYDGGGLDTIVSRSSDNGANWSYTFANYLGDNGNVYNGSSSTAFVDPALVVKTDANGNDIIYMLCDLYPYGIALNGSGNTQPTATVGFNDDGTLKLSKSDESGYNYYLKDGKIYSSNGTELSSYTVDGKFNITGNNVDTNLFFSDSPYQVVRTGYLYLTTSSDGGKTWSEPLLIPNIKTSSEMVCLVGPGSGLVLTDGTIIFPVYSYNGSAESQRTGFIYSTDDGKTWARSDSTINWSSESCIVQLDDTTLRVFYRNGNSRICYADVTKNGNTYTWGTEQKTSSACNSNTQLSALKVTYAGKDYILISCPGNESNQSGASYRKNGRIFAFDASDMSLNHTTSVNEDSFMYSSMALIDDGSKVALLYENKENAWGDGADCYYAMDFKTYDLSDLIETTGKDTDGSSSDNNGNETPEPDGDAIAVTTVELTVGQTSETYTVPGEKNYGTESKTTDNGVASYVQVGTAEVAGEEKYDPVTVTIGSIATSTNVTKTDYYDKIGNTYYPVYAYYKSSGWWTTYYYGYKTSDTGAFQEIESYNKSGSAVTLYKKTTTEAIPASTIITFAGESVGTTYVEVGSTTYQIIVTAAQYTETRTISFESSTTLNPTVPANGTVEYTITSGSSYITLNNNVVTAGNTAGTAVVVTKVKAANGNGYATYIYTIKVSDILEYEDTLSLPKGTDTTVSVSLEDGQTVEWSAEDSSIVGVAGVYDITAKAYGNQAYIVGYEEGTTVVTGTVKNADGTIVAIYKWNTTVTEAAVGSATGDRYINLEITQIENCTVYYSINGGELVKVNGTGVLIDKTIYKPELWNIMFFAAPDEGYALTYMNISNTSNQYYCLSDGNLDGTGSEAWPFVDSEQSQIPESSNSSEWKTINGKLHGFRWPLLEGNMSINQMKVMFSKAITYGCDGATSITKNAAEGIHATCQFVAQKLPTVSKTIKEVGGNTYVPGETKVELGNKIVYEVVVTRYATNATYGTITYSNEVLSDALTNNNGISNPDMGISTTSDKTFTYTTEITLSKSNFKEIVTDGTITNTVDFAYSYSSQYSEGTLSSSASATADNIEVVVPEYVIDFGLPVEIEIGSDVLGTDVKIVNGDATYGTVAATGSGTGFTYTPTSILQGTEFVTLHLSNEESYGVRIYPATTMYYEEGFAVKVDGTGTWSNAGSKGTSTQEATEPGTANANNYGYDAAYVNNTLIEAQSTTIGDAVTFTFTGTGVDIYANSTKNTGLIIVQIKDAAGKTKKLMTVDTALTLGTIDTEAGLKNLDKVNNIPIVSITDGLDYGTYQVIIRHVKRSGTDATEDGIILDGFRVYNTLNDTAESVYAQDKEQNPVYTELRNHVIASLNAVSSGSKQYADQIAKNTLSQVYSTADGASGTIVVSVESAGYTKENLQDFIDNCSKNELYLYPGQSLVFKVDTSSVNNLQIGLRTLNDEVTCIINNSTEAEKISSKTDMFYSLTPMEDGTCAITNKSKTGILSITKLKNAGVSASDENVIQLMTLTEADLMPALLSLGYENEPVEPEVTYADATLTIAVNDKDGNELAITELTVNGIEGETVVFAAADIQSTVEAMELPEGYTLADVNYSDVEIACGEKSTVSFTATLEETEEPEPEPTPGENPDKVETVIDQIVDIIKNLFRKFWGNKTP